MINKKIHTIVSITIIILIFLLPGTGSAEPEKVQMGVVNGTVITEDEYKRELERYKNQIATQGIQVDEKTLPLVKKQVMDNIVGMVLMYQSSLEKGIVVENTLLDKEWEQFKKQYPDEAQFQAALIKNNITEEIIKDQIKRGMTIQKFIRQNFTEKTIIPDTEVQAFYDSNPDRFNKPEKVKASQTLIKVTDKQESGKYTFEEIKNDLKNYLTKDKIKKDINEYVKKLRENANVEIY